MEKIETERLIIRTWEPKDDFDHPKVDDGHPLKRHVLYRIKPGEIR